MIDTGTSLYYPFIHPRSLGHLKAALLYWDRVRRIVPREVSLGGEHSEVEVLAENGLLLATDPEDYGDRACDTFMKHITPHAERFRIDVDTARKCLRRNQHNIHVEKVGKRVLDQLKGLGLAQQFGEWVTMHDEVGACYMFCLASEMGHGMSAPLFTDSPEEVLLGQSLLFEPSHGTPVSQTLIRAELVLPAPGAMKDVPAAKLVRFATMHSGERRRFRGMMEGIIETARTLADERAMDDYLRTKGAEIDDAVKSLRSKLAELHIGATGSVAKITVPAGVAAALAVLPISPVAAAILAGAGIAISSASVFAETKGKLRDARESSPYHYLISVEHEFGPSKNRAAIS